jgi:hypothetical protein
MYANGVHCNCFIPHRFFFKKNIQKLKIQKINNNKKQEKKKTNERTITMRIKMPHSFTNK